MTGLVLELQKDALNSSVPLSELLRKALVVAKKLRIKDFQIWIANELNGYKSGEDIPEYRSVEGEIKAWNPYNGWIPVIIQDVKTARGLRKRSVKQSIGDLESLVANKKEGKILMIQYSPEVENWLMDGEPYRPSIHIGANSIHGILNCVRNAVLEWSLKLEEEGIMGDGMSFSSEEKAKAHTSHSITIENFQGVFGNVSESTVNQDLEMVVKAGDIESLSQHLKAKGLEEQDIAELKQAIDTDPKPENRSNLGTNVSGWIGKMVSKAATGVWKVGTGVAGKVLASAICHYYGL